MDGDPIAAVDRSEKDIVTVSPAGTAEFWFPQSVIVIETGADLDAADLFDIRIDRSFGLIEFAGAFAAWSAGAFESEIPERALFGFLSVREKAIVVFG